MQIGVGSVELTANEWLKAEQLRTDYWLYIATDALSDPDLHQAQGPTRLLPGAEIVP
jgi:hypothetical protein